MKRFSKAIAGAMGAVLGKATAAAVKHFVPEMDSTAIELLVTTAVTSATVYVAPPNKPEDLR